MRAISPGQTQQALSDCNAALKIKPDAADVLDTRGFAYLKLGQTDNAIKDYDAALKLDQKLAGSLYGRGLAKARKGDRNGSTTDIGQPRRSSPTSPMNLPATARNKLQRYATSTAPAAISATPSQFGAVRRSPKNTTPKIVTSTTDSLSIGATCAACPIFRARK